jgi:mannosyltransferase
MTIRYPVTLDCIIFGLQRFGGISNYWAKLVEHVNASPALAGSLVLPKNLTYLDFDSAWLQRVPVMRETLDPRIGRYLPASTVGDGGVFHTSYYRLPSQRVGKYVVSVYDFTYERYRTGLARFVHTKQKLSSIRRADAVLCISESTRRDVVEFCPGVDPSKLHVVHLGVNKSTFFVDSAERNENKQPMVLFVGHRGGYKRFDLAVEAIWQSPSLLLGVVGPTLTAEERMHLQTRLGSRWHEFGPVATADLRRLYSSAFAFIFPSDYEGFGLPVLEAMACGCPVVAAAASSLPEVGGSAARYAASQTGEAYASALSDLASTSVHKNAVRAGLLRAAEFDWEHTLKQTSAVYLSP